MRCYGPPGGFLTPPGALSLYDDCEGKMVFDPDARSPKQSLRPGKGPDHGYS